MIKYYDRQGNPMEMMKWAASFEKLDNKIVKQQYVGELWVSTVWLGLDHNFGGGPPLIFETMVFDHSGGDRHRFDDLEQRRYTTEKEARAGHREIVARLIAGAEG